MKQLLVLIAVVGILHLGRAMQQTKPAIAAAHRPVATIIREGERLLKPGDIVVRLNRAPSSQFIKQFSQLDPSFSHSGIVVFENGYPYVYHVIDGDENPDGKIRRDSLAKFCDPNRNMSFAIYRYDFSAQENIRLTNYIHRLYSGGLRFDSRFDYGSDDRMYCSELVSKAIAAATNQRIHIEALKLTIPEAMLFSAHTQLSLSYSCHLSIVPIDRLYMHDGCRLVMKCNYLKNS